MPEQCPVDGGFIGRAGCTHPNHKHSALVERLISQSHNPTLIDVADCEAALREGFYINVKGTGRVGFGQDLLDHIGDHGSRKDIALRKMRLLYAIDTVRTSTPERNHRHIEGRSAYVKKFDGFGILAISAKEGKDIEYVFTVIDKRGLAARRPRRK